MSAATQIKEALKQFMSDGDANAANIYKGNDYDGVRQAYGWWYRPFNGQPAYLGASVEVALGTIEAIAEEKFEPEREESLSFLAAETGIPYNTLARYAREGRFIARKSGGVWLSTLSAVKAASIAARAAAPQDGAGKDQ